MSRKPDDTSDREVVLSREFDAPRELVFSVWTDPKHLANWWGPRGFTNTTAEIDIRPGGKWKFTMHGPDGRDYPNQILFHEIVKPERISYSHGDDADPHQFATTVTFEALGARTKVTMRAVFPTAAARDHVVKHFGAIEGGKQHLEKFAEQVERMKAAKGPFVMVRVFNAPRERVFRAWTEAEELKKWFGPKGFTMPICRNDLRPGGVMHYCLRGPDGKDMWGKWIWKEIVPPRKLVTLSGFSDPAGGWTRHPMAPVWPLETLATTTFDDEGGKTRLTLEWVPYQASDEERKLFDGAYESMRGGWTGTMEQLEAYLARG